MAKKCVVSVVSVLSRLLRGFFGIAGPHHPDRRHSGCSPSTCGPKLKQLSLIEMRANLFTEDCHEVYSGVVFSHPICYPQTMRITVQLPDDLIQYPDPGLRGFRSSGH